MYINTTKEIIDYLQKRDELFFELYNNYGLINHKLYNDYYMAIVFQIVGQMLSKTVGDKIFSRVEALCEGNVCAERIINLDREELRQCGMAYSKADYILQFTQKYLNGDYDFSYIERKSDEELITYLRSIKGVGLWTAEMLALFSFGRENIFSYDDVALRNGIIKAKGFKTLSKKRFEGLRNKYSPYCSFASMYFYKVNDDKEFNR